MHVFIPSPMNRVADALSRNPAIMEEDLTAEEREVQAMGPARMWPRLGLASHWYREDDEGRVARFGSDGSDDWWDEPLDEGLSQHRSSGSNEILD